MTAASTVVKIFWAFTLLAPTTSLPAHYPLSSMLSICCSYFFSLYTSSSPILESQLQQFASVWYSVCTTNSPLLILKITIFALLSQFCQNRTDHFRDCSLQYYCPVLFLLHHCLHHHQCGSSFGSSRSRFFITSSFFCSGCKPLDEKSTCILTWISFGFIAQMFVRLQVLGWSIHQVFCITLKVCIRPSSRRNFFIIYLDALTVRRAICIVPVLQQSKGNFLTNFSEFDALYSLHSDIQTTLNNCHLSDLQCSSAVHTLSISTAPTAVALSSASTAPFYPAFVVSAH